MAEEIGATVMGSSPGYLMACRKAGITPVKTHGLSALRQLVVAGSPLSVEGSVWVADQFGPDLMLCLGSGGTDVCTGIVQGNFLSPWYAGEMSRPCLGVKAQAFDEDGNVVVGELGELVITEPMPSMPVGFWNDPDDERYHATYFADYPGVWRQSDWVRFSERGSSIITGRSDATLNRGGVRLGTAEFYRVVEEMPEIADSLVVHLEDPAAGPGELLLFVVVGDDITFDHDLKRKIVGELRAALSPRHTPDDVLEMPTVPRNLTGKKLELPVKKILLGANPDVVASRDALGDPTSLDAYIEYAQSRDAQS